MANERLLQFVHYVATRELAPVSGQHQHARAARLLREIRRDARNLLDTFAQPPASGVDREIEQLRELYDSQAWAREWPHNIVPSGKPAHELACAAIRALPKLLNTLTNSGAPVPGDGVDAWDSLKPPYTISHMPANHGPGRYDESWTLNAMASGHGLTTFPTEEAAQARADEIFGKQPDCVFTIKLFAGRAQCRVQAAKGTDPATALRRAMETLAAEGADLAACPAHAAPAPSDEAGRGYADPGAETEIYGECPKHGRYVKCAPCCPEAGVPAGMVLDANRVKWLKAAAEFLDHCAGTELEFEGCGHGALAIVENLHDALFDDAMDMPFHEAVAWCLDHAKQATPTDEAASQGWQPIETAPKDDSLILVWRSTRWSDDPFVVVRWENDWWQVHDGKNDWPLRGADPTHWMPLPESPAPGSAGEAGDV